MLLDFTIRKSKGEYYQLKEPILATKERVDDVVFYTIFYPRLTTRIQGEARCQLTFINGNQVLMTKPYPFRVVEDLLDPDEIEIPDELLNVYERQLKEALEKTELKFNELSVNTENSLTELLNKGLVDIQSLINEGEISINQLISDSEHNIKLVIDNVNEEISEIVLEEVNKFNLLPRIEALENIDLSVKQDKILKDITTSKKYEFEIDNNRVFLKEV